jgi:hypothetical protein
VAGGYRELFAMGDVNYSQTDIGFDDRFRALIGSIRVGWNGKIQEVPVRLWVGGMYWGTRSTAKASVDVPNVGRVKLRSRSGAGQPIERHGRWLGHAVPPMGRVRGVRLQRQGRSGHLGRVDVSLLSLP